MKGCLTTTALLLVVLVLGMVLPGFIIGDGVNQYEGGKRKLAEQALSETEIFFAGGKAPGITAKRVSRVGTCRQSPPDLSDNVYDSLRGEVKLYAIFGLPYGELRFQCEGTEQILCPQAGAECQQGQGTAVIHLGQHSTTKDAMQAWEREIEELQTTRPKQAHKLQLKLDRLLS